MKILFCSEKIIKNLYFLTLTLASILYLYLYVDCLTLDEIKDPVEMQFINLTAMHAILGNLLGIALFIEIKQKLRLFLIILSLINMLIFVSSDAYSIQIMNIFLFFYVFLFACFALINFVCLIHFSLKDKDT